MDLHKEGSNLIIGVYPNEIDSLEAGEYCVDYHTLFNSRISAEHQSQSRVIVRRNKGIERPRANLSCILDLTVDIPDVTEGLPATIGSDAISRLDIDNHHLEGLLGYTGAIIVRPAIVES